MSQKLPKAIAKIPLLGGALSAGADVGYAHLVRLRSKLLRADAPESLSCQWSRVHSRSSDQFSQSQGFKPGGILLFPVWGPVTAPATKAIELILAHALHLRGQSVALMACHRALSACVIDPLGNHRGSLSKEIKGAFTQGAGSCVHCTGGFAELARHSLVPFLSLSEHALADDLPSAEREVGALHPSAYRGHHHAGVHVGEHAFASAIRATGRGTLEDTPLHNEIFRRQLIAAIVCARVAHRAMEALKPGQIGLTHGIYVDHGTIAEVARVRGIPVTVYVRPYRQSTVMLCRGDTYHRALVTEPNSLWEDHPLTLVQRKRLLDYIASRRSGAQDSITYHPNPIEGQDRIRKLLDLDETKPTVTAYTNVMWDAQLYHASSAFPDMLAWLFATIDHFIGRPDRQLVIRVHPAEVKAVKKSLQPVVSEIASRYGELPDNIKVVRPESDISSYDLAEMSSANIIYGTKMGLEMALMRRPVIVVGESFVRGKGFTHDASTPAEYQRLLDAAENLPAMDGTSYERALRYGYHFYFRRQIDLPFFTEEKGRVILHLDDYSALCSGVNKNLDVICDAFAAGTEMLAPW
jgi:hypothetical protein